MDANQNVCLNCGTELDGAFCVNCGQSAKTHRFSIGHIFSHDLIHGIFHIQRGFLYTLKELFTRPGNSIRDYVQGRRVEHFNYFTLLVISIIILTFIERSADFHYSYLTTSKEILGPVEEFRNEHPKIILIGVVPIYAAFSFLLFRRGRQNYAEHFVLNAYKAAANLLISALFISSKFFTDDIAILKLVLKWENLAIITYGTWFYFQYFSPYYTNRFLLLVRSVACIVGSLALIIGLIFAFLG